MAAEKLNHNNGNDNEELSLKEIIIMVKYWSSHLLSNWIMIVIIGVIGGIAGFTYALFKKPIYTATTTFVLADAGGGSRSLSGIGGIASMVGIDIGDGGGLFTGENILELYKSRKMIEEALLTPTNFKGKKELLVDRFIEINELKTKWTHTDWSKADFRDTAKFTTVQDSILGVIVKYINRDYLTVAKPDKKLSIIKVDVHSTDEFFAKEFANNIVSSVNKFYIDTKTKRSTDNVRILQHKVDSVRLAMYGSINTAATVVDATPNLNPAKQAQRTAPVQKAQFNAETNKAILGELVKNLEMAKMSLLKEMPLIQEVDEPILPLEKEKLGKIKGGIIGGFLFGLIGIILVLIKNLLKT